MMVQCKLCNKFMEYEELEKHYKRCSSIKYMQLKYKQLYGKDLNYDELFNADEITFMKQYYWLLNRVYESTESESERLLLENVLYGANHSLKDVI